MIRKTFFMLFLSIISLCASAQFYSARTNAIGLATGNFNIEGSMTLNRKLSLHLPIQYNPFTFGKKEFRNLYFSPGIRHWWRESYTGSFIGAHAILAAYSTAGYIDEYRYIGSAYGLGVSIGKAYPVSKKWNIEWEVGIAGIYTTYNKRINERCGRKLAHEQKFLFLPSKVCVNFVYLF